MSQKPDNYMMRPEELKKHPEALMVCRRIAEAAPADRQPAFFNAMWSFWCFAHAWDDLIDGSGWPLEQKELAWKALQEFVTDLLCNPVYLEHAAEFRALFTNGIARQLDAEVMKQQELAAAVRCADTDIMVHFAYLAGGWDLMRKIGKHRDYDPEVNHGGTEAQSQAQSQVEKG